jgi:hypothetical protein
MPLSSAYDIPEKTQPTPAIAQLINDAGPAYALEIRPAAIISDAHEN